MDDELVREALRRARLLTDGEPAELRPIAYRVVLERLLMTGSRIAIGATATPATVRLDPTGMDLTEFLAAKKTDTHPDRVVAIAYYVYHTHGGAGVTTNDLVDAYARARVKRPQNYPDVIAGCVRKGRLVETEPKDGKKCWVITRTGEAYVEGEL